MFPRLPVEIRLMIWRRLFPESTAPSMVFELKGRMPSSIWDEYAGPPMVTLHVNQESRNETLRFHQLFHHTKVNENDYMLLNRTLNHTYLPKRLESITFYSGDWYVDKPTLGNLSQMHDEFVGSFPDMRMSVKTLYFSAVMFYED